VTEVAELPAEQPHPDSSDKIDLSGESGSATAGSWTDNRRAIVILGAVAVAVLLLDLISKQLVVSHLREGEPVRWLGGAVYLVLVRNPGAAFSLANAGVQSARAIRAATCGWKMEAHAENDSRARFRIAGNDQSDVERFRRTL